MPKPMGKYFRDDQGRANILRGVNLGGSTKMPYSPYILSHVQEDFFNHRDVSFVGRPFPLEEAHEHFSRLQSWGFNCLRFLVTWEAIEHKGPGIYDQEYLDYVQQVVSLAGEYGFWVFIDPHQDVWSRFSGGDGAPGWTFETVGLNTTKFADTGAAIVHNTHGDPFPRMIWPTNYSKLAAATMFTLFFGGNRFAPKTKVEGEPIEDYLQRHYIDAIKQVALRVKDMPHVLGFDTLNEPSQGWIGWQDLTALQGVLKLGASPTPWQSIQLASGIPQEVDVWDASLRGVRKTGSTQLNPQGVSAWLPGRECIWRENGLWDLDPSGTPVLKDPGYFAHVDFANEHMKPFIKKFAQQIREVHPQATIFMEHEVMGKPGKWEKDELPNMVYAPHWYDPVTLFLKRYISFITFDEDTGKVVLGKKNVQNHVNQQFANFLAESDEMGDVPVLIGETGIAYDMHNKRAFKTGNFTAQIYSLDRIFQGLEANILNYTLWNYTADNTNHHGDGWNGEDLSIFSRDQQQDKDDPNSGGRALEAVLRPFPHVVAGEPLKLSFDIRTKVFSFSFRSNGSEGNTEIYIPAFQYPKGFTVHVSDGVFKLEDRQKLVWTVDNSIEVHTINIVPPMRAKK